MNNNNDNAAGNENSAPDFDDHEPGDVNGNVDPAWAKKQKQQNNPGERRPARAPRTPRATQSAAPRAPQPVASGTAQPVTSRTTRLPRGSRVPRGADTGEPNVLTDSAREHVAEISPQNAEMGATQTLSLRTQESHADQPVGNELPNANLASVNANLASVNANVAPVNVPVAISEPQNAEAFADSGGEHRVDVVDERRPRGPRRNRRGARDQRAPSSDNIGDRPTELANDADLSMNPQAVNPIDSADSVGRSEEEPHNPNPGAFGDPMRPMDRSARRNRNRNRKQEDYVERVQKSEAVHAARALRVAAAQNADGSVPIEEVQEVDRDGERLHKVLAQQGLGSRRAMESLIEAGEVEVNGKPAQVGQVVNERDRVFVKRRKVNIKLGDDNPRIMIYHKPAGEIVTRDDPEARDTVFDRLPRPDHGRWIAIGRLDYNTEGLLLFTTSGELANRMMHPRYEIMREYSVRVLGELTPEQEDQLIDGIELDDGPARVLSLDRIDRDSEGANHWYRITINEGRNREVRRMFEHLGLTVSRLIRTRYGAVNMPSWLKRGQYKLLDENDTFNVLEVVGMRSRKKLEKAARFGGARGKIPQGPIGPMRSSSDPEQTWSGAPPAGVGGQGMRGDRRGAGRNQRGRSGPGGRSGEPGFGAAPSSLQQQQFPGFGGGAADLNPLANRRARGNKMRRGPGGDVDGNVAPGYRGGANGAPRGGGSANNTRNGQGGNRRGGQRNFRNGPPRGQGDPAAQPVDLNASAVGGLTTDGQAQGDARNPRNRQRRGRNRQGNRGPRPMDGNAEFNAGANGGSTGGGGASGGTVGADSGAARDVGNTTIGVDGGNRAPRPPRNNRGPRRGQRRPRGADGASTEGSAPVAAPPTSSDE